MSNTLITAGLAAAEKMIARSLAYDPSSAQAIKNLAPQVLQLNFQAPELRIYVCFTEQGIELLQHFEGEVTAELSGSLIALAKVFATDAQNLKESGVRLEGKAAFINQLKTLAHNFDLDWEELLCQVFGDILGPQMAALIRKQIGWSRDRANNVARLAEEFLTHESGSLLSKPELENFYSQVNQLNLAAERLKARIDRLSL